MVTRAYYVFDPVQLSDRHFEANCRYCGERILFEKGENMHFIQGPDGRGGLHVIGIRHANCDDPDDNWSEGTIETPS